MIVVAFDLLALPGESLVTRKPCPDGRRIWNMLWQAHHGHVALLAVGNPNMEALSHWLKTEGYKPSIIDISREDGPDSKHLRLQTLQASFGKIRFYYDTDAKAVALALHEGIPSLLFANPMMLRPEWGTEKLMRPWDDLVVEMEQQQIKHNEATWGDVS